MATSFYSIFGNEIKVTAQPRQADRQYVGLPGVNGVIAMHFGTRGRRITVTGRLAATGASYSTARTSLQATIDTIEAYYSAAAAAYSHEGTTYNNVIFEKFELITPADGKTFRCTVDGYVICDFICYLRDLI